jgi:hypothetical protein
MSYVVSDVAGLCVEKRMPSVPIPPEVRIQLQHQARMTASGAQADGTHCELSGISLHRANEIRNVPDENRLKSLQVERNQRAPSKPSNQRPQPFNLPESVNHQPKGRKKCTETYPYCPCTSVHIGDGGGGSASIPPSRLIEFDRFLSAGIACWCCGCTNGLAELSNRRSSMRYPSCIYIAGCGCEGYHPALLVLWLSASTKDERRLECRCTGNRPSSSLWTGSGNVSVTNCRLFVIC